MDELFVEKPTEESIDIADVVMNDEVASSDLSTIEQIDLNYEGVIEEKPKRNIKLIAIISASVIALVAAVLLLWKPVAKLLGYTEQSPRDQFIYVETQATNDMVDQISALYGDFLLCLEEGMFAGESEIQLQLGDLMVDLLSTQMNSDASWMDGITIRTKTATDLHYLQVAFTPVVGDVELFTMDIIYDMQEQRILSGVPEMSSTYLFNNEAVDVESEPIPPIDQETIDGFINALPTEQALNVLLRKYSKTALSAIKTVTRKTETVTIEGIKQKCTVLETRLDANTYIDMAIAVLQEAKKGADLYSMVEQISDFATTDESMLSKTDWSNEIDAMIKALEEERAIADTESHVIQKDYLDSKGRLIGRSSMASDTGDTARYITVKKGSKFAYELNMGNMLVLVGTGTEKNNKINGDFRVLASGMEMATFEIIDFDGKKLDNNELSGTVRAKISKLIGELVFNTSADIDLTVDFVFNDKNIDGGMGVYVYSADEMLLGVGVDMEQLADYSINIPTDIIDANDEDATKAWQSSADYEQIMKNMKEAGIPQEFFLDLFMSAFNLNTI